MKANTLSAVKNPCFFQFCYSNTMLNNQKSKGAATVELAIFVPILALTLFLGVEVGRAIQARTLLVNGLHNSILQGLHTLYTDKSLWGRNNDDEIVIDGIVLDKMDAVLSGYVGNYDLLSPASGYVCQCHPPLDDEETTATPGKVACDDPDIVACPNESTQVYLTQSSGINFQHAFGGNINIGPFEYVIRVK